MSLEPCVLLVSDFLPEHEALFEALLRGVCWDRSMKARLTASFGESYRYSQLDHPAVPMHPALTPLAARLEQRLGIAFDNCLLNLYETGDNTMGFHSDDPRDLKPGTGVAIVSLGSRRDITYRRTEDRTIRCSFTLEPGSLLYMDAAVQEAWQHGIRKQPGAGPRISLSWRSMRKPERVAEVRADPEKLTVEDSGRG